MFKCAITKKTHAGVPHKLVVQWRETVHTMARRTYSTSKDRHVTVRWPQGVGVQIAREILVSEEAMQSYLRAGDHELAVRGGPGEYFAAKLGIPYVVQLSSELRASAKECSRQLRDALKNDEAGDGMPGVSSLFATVAALLTRAATWDKEHTNGTPCYQKTRAPSGAPFAR